jgi:hypothetical protein
MSFHGVAPNASIADVNPHTPALHAVIEAHPITLAHATSPTPAAVRTERIAFLVS